MLITPTMKGMTETAATDAPLLRALRIIAVLAFTILLACAVLSSHHDEAAPSAADTTQSETTPLAETVLEPAAVALAASGCALLAVCCLLALTVLRKRWRASPARGGRRSEPPAQGATTRVVFRSPVPPSLVALSISRT